MNLLSIWISVDQLNTSYSLLHRADETQQGRNSSVSTVAILGFQFGLYHVAQLSFLRSISLASLFTSSCIFCLLYKHTIDDFLTIFWRFPNTFQRFSESWTKARQLFPTYFENIRRLLKISEDNLRFPKLTDGVSIIQQPSYLSTFWVLCNHVKIYVAGRLGGPYSKTTDRGRILIDVVYRLRSVCTRNLAENFSIQTSYSVNKS